jgi:hypothetical protein
LFELEIVHQHVDVDYVVDLLAVDVDMLLHFYYLTCIGSHSILVTYLMIVLLILFHLFLANPASFAQ